MNSFTTCPKCGHSLLLSKEEKGKRISKGLLEAKNKYGRRIGCPRKFDYEKIRELRAAGFNYSQIARELKINRWSVRHACQRSIEKKINTGSQPVEKK